MRPFTPWIVPLFVTLVAACVEPKCPPHYEDRGDRCYRIRQDAGSDAPTDADVASVTAEAEQCYLDWDHDGAGAGQPVDCELDLSSIANRLRSDISSDVTSLPRLVKHNDDCDDENASRAPGQQELCDGMDNDCNDDVDEDATNDCGGPCLPTLAHSPGDTCTNGLVGSCAREGTYVCDGEGAVKCSAMQVAPSEEVCGDEVDNDCDGHVDEAGSVDAPSWYQDCDGDGYAAASAGSIRSCSKPPPSGPCSWTLVLPQPETKTNWDCNDGSDAYGPTAVYGFPPEGSVSWDLNCDGIISPKNPIVVDFPAHNPDIFVCNTPLITRLNAGNKDCDGTGDLRWNGCIVWKAADGTYTSTPSTKCPDTEIYRVRVQSEVPDPWGSNDMPRRHQTICRTPSSRPPPHENVRQHSSLKPHRDKTTPGASYCTVARVSDPVWPCR